MGFKEGHLPTIKTTFSSKASLKLALGKNWVRAAAELEDGTGSEGAIIM